MFDRFLCKNYNRYKNKKVKIIYDTKYSCNNETIGYLKQSPSAIAMSNKYTLPAFVLKNFNEPYGLITIPLLMVKNIFLIKEDYNTKNSLFLLKKSGIMIEDIYNHILSYIDITEYKEVEI